MRPLSALLYLKGILRRFGLKGTQACGPWAWELRDSEPVYGFRAGVFVWGFYELLQLRAVSGFSCLLDSESQPTGLLACPT